MNRNEVFTADAEYIKFAPVMDVAMAAVDQSGWTHDDWDAYGEQVGEIAMERALYAGSSSATHDAERIWKFHQVCRALQDYASIAPMHAEACEDLMHHIYV